MKRKLIQFWANMLFIIGDKLSWIAIKIDSPRIYSWYTAIMLKTIDIQDRYNLPQPWNRVDKHEHHTDCDCKEFD